ncbi:MAG: hypothetical protein ACRED1_06365 [Limisphaerales bacterium]
MLWQIISSFLQHSLTGIGAVVVTKGLASQSDTNTAVGAIMVLLGFGHSLYEKWKASQTPSNSSTKIPIVFLFIICASMTLTACSSTAPQRVTYQAAGTTIVTVDAAMNEWGAYVAATHPGTNEEAAVQSAYQNYQNAMAVVCDAGAVYSAGGGTNATATAALDQAMANSSQELSDLETLIKNFGVKLQ